MFKLEADDESSLSAGVGRGGWGRGTGFGQANWQVYTLLWVTSRIS